MANSNFIVHNGLTVGPTTIDAASGNITVPSTKRISIGNVQLYDNGDGKLRVRDITDNSDVTIVATLTATSVTDGNIQIGTNHIESVNADGPVSLRPNGAGTLVFASNVASVGKGAPEFIIETGFAMPGQYGVTYANANIVLSPGRLGYGGNVWINQTTAATSSITGAFTVTGGVGIGGAIHSGPVSPVSYSNPVYNGVGNANAYVQLNVQNINSTGTNASSDFVATAPNGTDSANFIDMGINGNLFVSPGSAWTVSGPNDGYVYIDGGNLTLGTATTAKDLILHTGGLLASNIKARVYDSAGNLTVFVPLNLSTNSNVNATASWVNAGTVNVTGNILAKNTTLGATTVNGTTALNGTATTQIVQPDGDNTRTLGASGTRWSTVYGVTFSGTSTTANYADVAEKYTSDAVYEPGTVLQFGGLAEVTLAEDGTTKVAGVVSTNPAYLMNDLLVGENTVALALTGRVPTKVQGTVAKGDMMVSAGNGRARAEANPKLGSVIGKALENFDGVEGTIEVVIGIR
jgi:hypothetical protein